jgi:hypothetical protein
MAAALVIGVDEPADGCGEVLDVAEGAAADGLAGDDATMFSHEQLVGVKCSVIRWFAGSASHLRTSGCLCVA